MELTEKEKKILFELDFNSRDSLSKIGKRVELNKQTLNYNIKSLEKRKIIKNYYTVINVNKLGFSYCRVFLTLKNINLEKYCEIFDYLKKNKKIFWLFKTQGSYDLIYVMWVKNMSEIVNFTAELHNKYGHYIKRKNESIITSIIHYQNRYLNNNSKSKTINLCETNEIIEIDEIDKKILKILSIDAKISIIKISKLIKVSSKTIIYRIKKMEKNKLILEYRPNINYSKLGYTNFKIFLNSSKIDLKMYNKLIKEIQSNPIVTYYIEGVGIQSDIDFEIMINTNEKLYSFIKKLRFSFPEIIREYEAIPILETCKVKYLPF